MKMDYVKAVLKEKRLDILFLQATEIPDGYDTSLLTVILLRIESRFLIDNIAGLSRLKKMKWLCHKLRFS